MFTLPNNCILELSVGANGENITSYQFLLVGAWIAARVSASEKALERVGLKETRRDALCSVQGGGGRSGLRYSTRD